jgi:uncharacterized protein (TIGR03382 family)
MRFLASVMALVVMPIGVASAHIHLTYPLSRTDEPAGNMQKSEHCGAAPGRTNRVSTFRPGETITVTWAETIGHPGWFRVAFQPNGETFGIPPVGNTGCRYPVVQPCENNAPGNFPSTAGQEGPDANNGSIVLKDMIADGMLSQSITFPNMECTNCTLQLTQVMTDKFPYTDDAASDDIYFNCADITLSNTAPMVDAGVPSDGGGGSNNGGDASGGCASSGGTLQLGAGLLLLGLLRRRRDK